MRSDDKYLEISHLTKVYPKPDGGEAVIVRDFDFAIAKGEFVCLIGHSGCGKSTVLSIAAGLLPPTEGGVLVDDKEIPGPGPDRGVVFQSPCLLPWMSAFDNVMTVAEKEEPIFVDGVTRFDAQLRAHTHPGLTYAFEIIAGERHSGTKPESFNRGVRFAFAPRAPAP